MHRSGVRSHVHSTLKLSLCFASQFLYTVYTCSPDRRCVGSVAVTPHHPSTTPPRTYTVGVNTHNDQNCVDTVPSLGPHPYPMAHHISPRTLRSHRRHPVPIHAPSQSCCGEELPNNRATLSLLASGRLPRCRALPSFPDGRWLRRLDVPRRHAVAQAAI